MKQLFTLILSLSAVLLSFSVFAQAPQSLSYQAVARNNTGIILPNKSLGIRISVHDATASGTVVYQETFSPKTNALGLFTLNIGNGIPVSGTFTGIDWASGSKFLQVEMDSTGGSNYTDMGTTQLLSVPYALYAGKAGNGAKAGAGIKISNDSVINASPDEVVNLTGTGSTKVIGTYPNFTVHSDSAAIYTNGAGLNLTGTQFSAQNTNALWNANQLQGAKISSTGPLGNQVLKWNPFTGEWAPSADSTTIYFGGNGISVAGDTINGVYTGGNGIHVAGDTINGIYTGGNGIHVSGDTVNGIYTGGNGIRVSGDTIKGTYTGGTGIILSGSSISAQSTAALWNSNQLQGNNISTKTPTNRQVLKWDSVASQWGPANDSVANYSAGTGISINGTTINSAWTASGPNIFNNNTGDVGIGKSPNYTLDVKGPANADSLMLGGITQLSVKGTQNIFLGQYVGNKNTAKQNQFEGYEAGYSNTSGTLNYFSGLEAGYSNNTGEDNFFIGPYAGYNSTTGFSNFFVGFSAGYKNTVSIANTFIGSYAGYNNTTGWGNYFSGFQAGYSNTTSSYNYFSGYEAGLSNTYGYQNEFIGTSAGFANTSGWQNLFIGDSAGYHNTVGRQNYFEGFQAGFSNTGAVQNHFQGYQAGYSNTSGYWNSFVGFQAGYLNTTGYDNVFEGFLSGYYNTTGASNVFIGNCAGLTSKTGNQNTFIGDSAGNNNRSSSQNVFIGCDAGYSHEIGNGNYFSGYQAGYLDFYGTENFFSGYQAGFTNIAPSASKSDGDYNQFEGYQAGYNNCRSETAANYNFFYGLQAGYKNDKGTHNTYIGGYAGYNSNTSYNQFIGFDAGYSNTTGYSNDFSGAYAGYANTTGSQNCFSGDSAGYDNTTGNGNYFSGYLAGTKNTTGINNMAIGNYSNVSSGALTNASAIGFQSTVSVNNTMSFGNASVTAWAFGLSSTASGHALQVGDSSINGNGAYLTIGGVWTNASDRNKKENFTPLNSRAILDKICILPITQWNYKGSKASNTHIGPIAQDFYRLFHTGDDSLAISTIDPAGVALIGVQELKKENEKLQKENEELKLQVEKLNKQNTSIKGTTDQLVKEVAEIKNALNNAPQKGNANATISEK